MKKTSLILTICLLFIGMNTKAQQKVKLWSQAPTENGITAAESLERDGTWLTNVSQADLTIYLPPKEKNTGLAVIICPGGGYAGLAIQKEGSEFAKWLNEEGIAGIVLKYRMPNKNKEIPLDDAWQAIRYVREHSAELGINPQKVGIAGFSAGGHLASTASTHFALEGANTRPDFSILFYPVVTMDMNTHGGSKNNLLGDNPSDFDIYMYSNEKQVTQKTPPTILLLSDDDKAVPPINSTMYYDALKRNNIPATMYIFPEGGHGWGMEKNFRYHTQMLDLLSNWLKDLAKENK